LILLGFLACVPHLLSRCGTVVRFPARFLRRTKVTGCLPRDGRWASKSVVQQPDYRVGLLGHCKGERLSIRARGVKVPPFCENEFLSMQQSGLLLDHLIGECQKIHRQLDARGLRDLEVYDEFVVRWLFKRQISRQRAAQDARGEAGSALHAFL